MTTLELPDFLSPHLACSNGVYLHVDVAQQRLRLVDPKGSNEDFAVSTAAAGAGERSGSGRTPRGWHIVRAKIGEGAPVGMVFVGRRPTGEIFSESLSRRYPDRDWILTRILWLSGLEIGRNRLGSVDTQRRYIYIHGSPDTVPMGVAGSHGCIRMRNRDVMRLFQRITPGTPVLIEAG